MHRNAVAACERHLVKWLRHIMGTDTTKVLRVSRVNNDSAYICGCGKTADFYILEQRAEKSVPPAPHRPAPLPSPVEPGTVKGGDSIVPFPRKKHEW